MNKTNLIPSLLLALILIAAAVLIGVLPTHDSAAYPPPESTPEPTCLPPSPDYPEPCHEHGGPMIITEPIYLPIIEK